MNWKFALLIGGTALLMSCKSEPETINETPPIAEAVQPVADSKYDTVRKYFGQSFIEDVPLHSDTNIIIDDVLHTFEIDLSLKDDTVFYDEESIQNDVVYIYRYSGRDIEYTFRLIDGNRNLRWEKKLSKKDYMKELGSIVAQSNMSLPEFHTFYPENNQLLMTHVFWVPDSDVGVEGLVTIDKWGVENIKYNRWYGSSGSQCEFQYSPDSSCLLTCSELWTSTGKRVSLRMDSTDMAGNLFIGKDHILVTYSIDYSIADHNKLGGRLYNTSGTLIKEFDYKGVSGALSYEIPYLFHEDLGQYYFVDETSECFHQISLEAPWKIRKVPFSTIRNVVDEDIQGEIQTEGIQHKIGLDSSGIIQSHQMRYYGEDWQFYDQIKH